MSQQYSSHHLIVRPDARHTFSAKECDVEQEFAFSSRRFGADLKSAEMLMIFMVIGEILIRNKK